GRLITDLVADGREQTVVGMDDLFTGLEDQEVARPVGVLALTALEGRLSERGRLLITENSGDRRLAQQRRVFRLAVDLGRRTNLRQHRTRYTEGLEDVVAPLERFEVHEHGAGRVGDVGSVHAAVNAARQVPQYPRVRCTEEQVPGLGPLA